MKTCLNCGKQFAARKLDIDRGYGKFCSRACSALAQQSAITKPHVKCRIDCAICGMPFDVDRHRASQAKFCSEACYLKSAITRVERQCLYCGKTFMVNAFKATTAKYCSRACKKKDLAPVYVKLTCKQCGTFFEIPESHMNRKDGIQAGRFCQIRCWSVYMKQHMPNKETKIERIVRESLIKQDVFFYPQHCLLNRYTVDFFLPNSRIIIEADGSYWHNLPGVPERDKRKDEELRLAGYTIIRLKEKDLNNHKSHSPSECKQVCIEKALALL